MILDHDTVVGFAKSWGLFYLIALAIVVLVYAFWPSNLETVRRGQEEHPRRGRQAMEVGERDPVTGRLTTGHEWNGIKELYTPVPRVVIFFLVVGTLFAVGYWILMPAWPLGRTYTKGLLGIDQRAIVERQVEEASAERAAWTQQIDTMDFAAIKADPALMEDVRDAGRTLFGDNCAVCHGMRGTGGKGFPDLTAGAWLWGGEPETVAETLRVGINSSHDETRVSQMMAFGRDGNSQPGADRRCAGLCAVARWIERNGRRVA